MKLYHVTTEKKAKLYRQTGSIIPPVRGFNTLIGAMYWAIKVGRKVIYEVEAKDPYKLPDHHNEYGSAWWTEKSIPIQDIKCVCSPK